MSKHERLRIARERSGITSAADAARALGLGVSTYSHHENGTRGFNDAASAKYARRFGVSKEWLVFGTNEMSVGGAEEIEGHTFGVRFGGIVEAGAFRQANDYNQDAEYRTIGMSSDPRFPHTAQYAFEVFGDSMTGAGIFEGMFVLAVDLHAWEKINGEPRDGLPVVVSRTRNGDPERELTVKRLRIFRDRMELQPETENKQHKPLVFSWPPPESDHAKVQIIGVVLSAVKLMG